MKTDKQLRVLETKGRYKVVNGRVYHLFRGEWKEKTAGIIGGYRQHILFNGRGWGRVVAYEHDIVWLYEKGVFRGVIDHINHVRDDNRIENLRAVSSSENKLHSPRMVEYPEQRMCIDSGQVYKLLDTYCNTLNKSESARKAKVDRVVGLYHINKFLKTGMSSYLDAGVCEGFRNRLLSAGAGKGRIWSRKDWVAPVRKRDYVVINGVVKSLCNGL